MEMTEIIYLEKEHPLPNVPNLITKVTPVKRMNGEDRALYSTCNTLDMVNHFFFFAHTGTKLVGNL